MFAQKTYEKVVDLVKKNARSKILFIRPPDVRAENGSHFVTHDPRDPSVS